MDYLDFIFPYSTRWNSLRSVPVVSPVLDDISVVANEEYDVISPVDPGTKSRPNVLSKITDPRLTSHERDMILASFTRLPTSKRSKLSDDDLIAMLPSRYNATMVDTARFADSLRDLVDSDRSSADSDPDTSAEDLGSSDSVSSDVSE